MPSRRRREAPSAGLPRDFAVYDDDDQLAAIKLAGLPAGTKAEPVTVPPDKDEFTVKVVADAKAAKATAKVNVALAFQINKKDYSTPTTPLEVTVAPAK